ncbi:DUF6458 family protein [uncultured Jatrophihabitans sp.]|uniref:DUF6458 family protein n=1 Tax=uncultured Jatrophihabitans sp. TaxID=1610747 RepID=UPI0035C98E82
MRIGGALFVIALGAVLKFAVSTQSSHGVNFQTVGLILLIVGAVWLVAEIVYATARRRTDVVHRGPYGATRTTVAEPPPVDYPY